MFDSNVEFDCEIKLTSVWLSEAMTRGNLGLTKVFCIAFTCGWQNITLTIPYNDHPGNSTSYREKWSSQGYTLNFLFSLQTWIAGTR